MPLGSVHREFDFSSAAQLPVWLTLLLGLAAAALVCWQLRRELDRARPPIGIIRALFALRLLIVGLICWLLCQPQLTVHTRWQVKPQLLVFKSSQRSMQVREDFPHLYQKIDVLEALSNQQYADRNRSAARLRQSVEQLQAQLAQWRNWIASELSTLASGLPPGPAFASQIDQVGQQLASTRSSVLEQLNLLPTSLSSEMLQAQLVALTNQLQLLSVSLQVTYDQLALVRDQAATHPELLDKLLGSLGEIASSCQLLVEPLAGLQAGLDETFLTSDLLTQVSAQKLTRRELADLAARRIEAMVADRFEVVHQNVASLQGAFESMIAAQVAGPVRTAVLLDDGAVPLGPVHEGLLSSVVDAGIRVQSVLVGTDGVQPLDAGLMSIDGPTIAIAGQAFTVRALVQSHLPPEQSAQLVATSGGQMLSQEALTSAGLNKLTLKLTLPEAGRQQVVFEVRTQDPDAYAGNERFVTTIDVLPQRPRVLVVSDRLSQDAALFKGVTEHLEYADLSLVIADEELDRVRLGDDAGEFPGKPEDWQHVQLVVLLGDRPDAIKDEALAVLQQMIESGLPVLVVDSGSEQSWARWLNLVSHSTPPAALQPRPHLWLDLYRLAATPAESLARWRQLPTPSVMLAPSADAATEPGISLVMGNESAPLQWLPRKAGGTIYVGLPQLASLRRNGNAASVGRLVAGLIDLGLQAHPSITQGPRFFPPQPTAGKLWMIYDLSQLRTAGGLDSVPELKPGSWFRVGSIPIVTVHNGESQLEYAVQRPAERGDFELAAQAAGLQRIASETGGAFAPLSQLPQVLAALDDSPVPRWRTQTWRLWDGWWPVPVLLVLVTLEYLLRRRAGRVM